MKKKDLVFALLAVIILLVAGYVAYTQLLPKPTSASAGVEVEIIGNITAKLDASGLARLNDRARVNDYNTAVDFSGLGNKAPFGL